MTQNKTRDELAEEFCKAKFCYAGEKELQHYYKAGWDAAEKQYLGEIQELKSKSANYKLCLESQRKQDEGFYKKYAELKADLESSLEMLTGAGIHIANTSTLSQSTVDTIVKDYTDFVSTLKSKLGRGNDV